MKVAIYARVSTDHHDQRPELQIDELKRYCSARQWVVSHEIIDHGFSGSTEKRPGLKKLLNLVRNRDVDAVVVLKLDRLFRSLKHLLVTLEEFHALGVTFIATKDQIDYTTPAGRLFIGVLGSLAEFEKELCRERTILGLAHARSLGKRLGRPSKYNPVEIITLRRTGKSYREITRLTGAPAGCIARALRSAPKSPVKLSNISQAKTGV